MGSFKTRVGFILGSLLWMAGCSDSEPQIAPALPVDNFIPGTEFKPEELPFSQFEKKKFPLKIAGLWKYKNKEKYVFVSMKGVLTEYMTHKLTDCLVVRGPHYLSYYGNNRYEFNSKRYGRSPLAVQQLEYKVGRLSMTRRKLSATRASSERVFERMTDIQPEDLNACRDRNSHPFR